MLKARAKVSVRAVGPFGLGWNTELSTAENIGNIGCRDIVWRIGEGKIWHWLVSRLTPGEFDLGDVCPNSVIIE